MADLNDKAKIVALELLESGKALQKMAEPTFDLPYLIPAYVLKNITQIFLQNGFDTVVKELNDLPLVRYYEFLDSTLDDTYSLSEPPNTVS